MSNRMSFTLNAACLSATLTLTLFANAQQALKAGYYTQANTAGVQDNRLVISNPDVYAGGNGNLCAMIYVFDQFQQMQECCGCLSIVDGERELSINHDLTANPMIPRLPTRGSIRIVSNPPNSAGVCDPTTLDNPQPELLAWGTHPAPSNFSTLNLTTETDYQDVPLSTREAGNLALICDFVRLLGSGRGVCTCGTGD
jgi:hypothetical protein